MSEAYGDLEPDGHEFKDRRCISMLCDVLPVAEPLWASSEVVVLPLVCISVCRGVETADNEQCPTRINRVQRWRCTSRLGFTHSFNKHSWSTCYVPGPLLEVGSEWRLLSRVRLCDPMDYTVPGILQARILEWVAFPFSRGPSQPRDQTQVSHIADRFFIERRLLLGRKAFNISLDSNSKAEPALCWQRSM